MADKKLRSISITIQDVMLKDGEYVAGIFGTLAVDTGEKKLNEKMQAEPVLESTNFTTALSNHPAFQEQIKQLVTEALQLKAMKVMQEEGLMAMFNKPTPKKRVSKVRKKK